MKLIRLLILFGNLALIIITAYLGYYFFFKGITDGSEYFGYKQIVTEPPEKYLPKDTSKRGKEEGEYAAITRRFGPPAPKVEPPPPTVKEEESNLDVLKKQLQVKSVVYNAASPSRSGIHVLVGAVPRYFVCGDFEPLSRDLNFNLTGVKEVAPGEEYLLIFRKNDGNIVEFPYKKSSR
jgi:hypothetical protein